ncbi:cytochrome P450 [Mycena olivaceomarginata]|nr:cytochrome P450 [Mycena olivaceomarginata]
MLVSIFCLIFVFKLTVLFAGTANAAAVAGYFLCYLASHPSYLAQVREEIDDFLSSFSPDATLPLIARLQHPPPPRRALKETLRLRIATPMHRLNDTGKHIDIGGMRVPRRTILTGGTPSASRRGGTREGDPHVIRRFASFEMFIMTALMVSLYDIELVDTKGRRVD